MLETLCQIGFVAALFSSCTPQAPALHGYVEGEYIRLSPLDPANIATISVNRGDKVEQGSVLFAMEVSDANLARDSAAAQLAQAKSDLANISQGRRPQEIAVIDAALAQAKASATEASQTYNRQIELSRKGVTAKANLDNAKAALDAANAAVQQQQANRDVAELGARPDEIAAAQNKIKQAEAALQSAEWRLAQRTVRAPAQGMVTTIIRRPGEAAGPTAPVIEMLPVNAVKVVFYVPEAQYADYSLGSTVQFKCDGCGENLRAQINWKASEAEFTPPVIYSTDARQKLVYLLEARPDEQSKPDLRPGQIVDVSLPQEQ